MNRHLKANEGRIYESIFQSSIASLRSLIEDLIEKENLSLPKTWLSENDLENVERIIDVLLFNRKEKNNSAITNNITVNNNGKYSKAMSFIEKYSA